MVGATSFGTERARLWVEGGYSGGTNSIGTYTYLTPGPNWGTRTVAHAWGIGTDEQMLANEYNIYSDERLKKDFINLQNTEAYDKINQTKIYKYKLKKELDYYHSKIKKD